MENATCVIRTQRTHVKDGKSENSVNLFFKRLQFFYICGNSNINVGQKCKNQLKLVYSVAFFLCKFVLTSIHDILC